MSVFIQWPFERAHYYFSFFFSVRDGLGKKKKTTHNKTKQNDHRLRAFCLNPHSTIYITPWAVLFYPQNKKLTTVWHCFFFFFADESMRGGFGRYRYERPQPGLQLHSYEDAIYPPRAYRYHVQQTATAAPSAARGAEAPATAIVLPTIDADATCGPFLKGNAINSGGNASFSGSVSAVSGASLGYLGRSVSAAPSSTGIDGTAAAVTAMDAERRPPPRLRYFFDCFVSDEDGADAQTLSEVCRHAEPLNPFHYRELWGGMDGAVAEPSALSSLPVAATTAVKAEPVRDGENGGEAPPNGGAEDTTNVDRHAVHAGAEEGKLSVATRAATRAAQHALQRTLRALGVPDELGSMVLLAARVPPGGRLSRKQEKLLRLRHQRRPAPPRPIRRGAKVFMPAYAVLASEAHGPAAVGATTAATGGLIDVTAAGPRVLCVQHAMAHQHGAFGMVGGGGDAGSSGDRLSHHAPAATAALVNEFVFDDEDDDEDKHTHGRGDRRVGGGKRSRAGDDDDGGGGVDDGGVPLIASGRWSQLGGPGSGGNGPSGGPGTGTRTAAAAAGQLDEEAESDSDEEDDLSTGMAEDDDDDANFSDNGGSDNDSFGGGGGGDDGNDDY